MMISDPSLVRYACVAKDNIVVAEFNSEDADLGALAMRCLEKTPEFHSMFTHTVRQRTYTFLIESPFVYLAIFDERLEKSEGLAFLRGVKEGFDCFVEGSSTKKRLEHVASHCFQGEFNPIFHQLLDSMSDTEEAPHSPRKQRHHERRGSGSGSGSGSTDSLCGRKMRSATLFGEANNLKKKKKRLLGESRKSGMDLGNERKLNMGDDGAELSREFSVSMHKNAAFSGELGHQRAKKVWKKQVWVVLSLDLIVCTILFVIWLWVCRGFKCIDG
ncbi:PREDICTED: phytolongin Phyl2.1 [Ipomoea nil]|uniref:phytolongin Phyl2.1 n=1 Tax=Ipomoea nil TaxID=35883 RepID=UPI000900EE05|nr:PREDICTED: phytolongin Phyl2.1 [Ipomoea nil]